jgi:hypothetical protein
VKLSALLLLASPSLAVAADFDTRVAQAQAAIGTREGYAYDMALVPAIHAATVKCVPPGRAAARRADVFTAIATVDAGGRVSDVQVRPATPLALCFARQLGTLKLRPPPRPPRGHAGHPILVQVRDRF